MTHRRDSHPTVGDVKELRVGEFVFTRDDAIQLARNWQEYAYGNTRKSIAGDNVENMIEELCLAWGFSVAEVRETWWRRRQCNGQHDWVANARVEQMCRKCGALKSEYETTPG